MKNIIDYYLDYSDRFAKEKAQQEALNKSKIFNQFYPDSLQSQIDAQRAATNLRDSQARRQDLYSNNPELMAGQLGQEEFLRERYGKGSDLRNYIDRIREERLMPKSSSDPLAKQHALLDIVRSMPADSIDSRLAKAELNNMAAQKGGTTVTVDGKTISFGSPSSNSLFPSPSQNMGEPSGMGPHGISTITQPSARSRAGMTWQDSSGQRYSVEASPVLTQDQKASAAIQNILSDLPKIKYLAAYGAPLKIGAAKKKYAEFLNYFGSPEWVKKHPEYKNYTYANQLYKSMVDNLMSAFNVPRTNKGLETIEESISPMLGENVDAYEKRLNSSIVPNILKRFELINERLHKGLPVYDLLESDIHPNDNISSSSLRDSQPLRESPEKVRVRNTKTGRTGRVNKENLEKVLQQGDWTLIDEK